MVFLALSLSDIVFIMLINVKMSQMLKCHKLLAFLTFLSMINFMFSWVEHVESFITSGLGLPGHQIRRYYSFNAFCRLLIFFKISVFPKHSYRNTIRLSPVSPHFVGLDLGPNCLQRLSADDTTRQRVNFLRLIGLHTSEAWFQIWPSCSECFLCTHLRN